MDLLFEIGCEELPAGSLKPAVEWMSAALEKGLDEARLNGDGTTRARIQGHATPRRLALVVQGIAARAPDLKKKLSGPPAKQAFGPDGKPTKAGEGFARKAGVPVEALRVEGDRVVVDQEIRGQTAAEALPALLAQLVRGIPFRKSMRWGALDRDPFARPVHWLLAMLDGTSLPVGFADVESGGTTRGHRFHAPAGFPAPTAAGYVAALREHRVLVDWAERRARIQDEVLRAAAGAGGEPLPDDDLLETVTGLVEEPSAVLGTFDPAFLELPPEVLVSEMKGHQKYFSVRNPANGKLLPAFVAVSNTRVDDPAFSRRGYERVLRARLSDGKFFFDEDRKLPLRTRVERLGRRTWVAGLGTELERAGRVRELALWLHGATGRGEPAVLREAAELCKADLTTGMVGEFPELQGVMGRVYALHDGLRPEVADAIFEHYLPRGAEDQLPRGDAGALLGLADRLDALVGLFGIGKEPTGTADPYALRRAALGIVRVVLAKEYRFDLRAALAAAQAGHAGNPKVSREPALLDKVWGFLSGRLEASWQKDAQPDGIQAVLATGASDLVSLRRRLEALQHVRRNERAHFEATAAAFRRIANILTQAAQKGFAPMGLQPERATTPAERALIDSLAEGRARVTEAVGDREDYLAAYGVLAELRPLVDRFFDDVMVMDPDPAVRDNRLALLRALHELFAPLAEFSRLQVDKTA